jgi:hypothetical protein
MGFIFHEGVGLGMAFRESTGRTERYQKGPVVDNI